jgi:predicted transcriptional regulator of viral defense system
MTLKGHEMFSDYLKRIRSVGHRSFTLDHAIADLRISINSAKLAISRLKKQGRLISPAKGFYVIIPPEHQPQGCIPAAELVPILMDHLGIDYYACLLTAGLHHGATHQKAGSFQIMTHKRIKRKLQFGRISISCIYKKSFKNLPIQQITVSTGYLKISSPELTAVDLLTYSNNSGGLNHIATVLTELVDVIDPKKLIDLAKHLNQNIWFQRLGYILEKIDPIDTERNQKIINTLSKYLESKKLRFIPLAPEISSTDYPRSKKWMVIENTDIESDDL